MFVAALLDLNPARAEPAIAATREAGLAARVALEHRGFTDGILSGSRFIVEAPPPAQHHAHVHWSELRARLAGSALSPPVRERAIAIFSHLAEAEARVHDKPVDDVAFHEVGAWDSIADIVAAAFLIDAMGPCSWSIGPVCCRCRRRRRPCCSPGCLALMTVSPANGLRRRVRRLFATSIRRPESGMSRACCGNAVTDSARARSTASVMYCAYCGSTAPMLRQRCVIRSA